VSCPASGPDVDTGLGDLLGGVLVARDLRTPVVGWWLPGDLHPVDVWRHDVLGGLIHEYHPVAA
jgi:hypothetical protein